MVRSMGVFFYFFVNFEKWRKKGAVQENFTYISKNMNFFDKMVIMKNIPYKISYRKSYDNFFRTSHIHGVNRPETRFFAI